MRLDIKNIGKIGSATVDINGITVIAGENNTGKSTVGKVLFCIFNSFFQIQEQINLERKIAISEIIDRSYLNATNRYTMRFDSEDFADILLQNSDNLVNTDEIENVLNELYTQSDNNFNKIKARDSVEDAAEKIKDILNIPDKEIFRTVLSKRMAAEFNGQINNIYNPQKEGIIKLTIKNEDIIVNISNDEVSTISDSFNLNTEVIYIDDPFVLDEVRRPRNYRVGSLRHRDHLILKLYSNTENSSVKNAISEIVVSKKLEAVFNKLNSICSGEIVRSAPRGYAYQVVTSDALLDVRNISTGLKTFVILKTLLLNSSIESNGCITLDEPEIHLHPEWQLIFAELIVLIQKEFGLHILLNTHSPYFLNAIEVYSAKHQIADKCKYYLAENQGDQSILTDVTNDIEVIYAKLASPLQKLETERYAE